MKRFPKPAKLNWASFNTFGYPWHGKWQQAQQANGQWKDALTLITEAGENAPETPAPIFDDGSTIPKLASGVHLIDVQMPWAKEDVPENTPPEIAAMGGKYWNRALYAADTCMLYGKSLRKTMASAEGRPPNGRVDFLYGDPDGTVWGCALFIEKLYEDQSWVPGKGEPGTLKLMARKVAGRLLHTDNPESQSPDFSSHWITIPLSGAQSLSELFPNAIDDVPTDQNLFIAFKNGLRYGASGTASSATPYPPTLTFIDALPDGKKSAYGVAISNRWHRLDASDTSYVNYRGVGDLSVFVCLFELELTGIPGNGGAATLVRPKSPAELLVYEAEGVESVPLLVAAPAKFEISPPGVQYGDSATYSAKVSASKSAQSCLSLSIKFPVMAGYVDGVLKVVDFRVQQSDESSGTVSVSGSVTGSSAEISSQIFPFVVTASFSVNIMRRQLIFIGDEEVASCDMTDSDAFVLEQPASMMISCHQDQNGEPLFSCTVYAGGVGKDWWGSMTGNVFGKPFTTTGHYVGGEVSANRGDTGHVSIHASFPWFDIRVLWLSRDGRVVRFDDGAISGYFLRDIYCGSVTPQVIKLAVMEMNDTASMIFVDNIVRTLGQATSDGTPPHALPTLQRNISWCPIRDQLLVTDRPSSWV